MPGTEGTIEADGEASAAPAGNAGVEGGAGQQARVEARESVAEGEAAAGGDPALPSSEPQADPWLEPHGVPRPLRSLPSTRKLGLNP